MRTSLISSCSTLFIMLVLLLSACKKGDLPQGPACCQVYKVKYYTPWSDMDSAVFTYNSRKDPIRITRGFNSTGTPDALFWYDKRGRLTDYIGIYRDTDSYEFRHRYAYDHKDRIVADTTYTFGFIGGYMGSIDNFRKFKYDAQNRIIRMDHMVPSHPGNILYSRLYIYNGQGNIEKITGPDGYVYETPVYDDKININNLHPLWQFFAQDYSRNNPFGYTGNGQQTLYNQHGLPIDIDKGFGLQGFWVNIAYSRMTVEYQCQ